MQKDTEYEGHEVLHVRAYGSAFFTLGINIRSVFVANTSSFSVLITLLIIILVSPPSLSCFSHMRNSVTTFRVLLEDDRVKKQIKFVSNG